MIVDKIWTLTNALIEGLDSILGPQTHRDEPLSRTRGSRVCNGGNTHTGKGVKGKKVRTTLDDAGGVAWKVTSHSSHSQRQATFPIWPTLGSWVNSGNIS